MHTIVLCALGPCHGDDMTRGAWRAMQSGTPLLLRTEQHGICRELEAQGIAFETLDALYEACEDFDELCAGAYARILDFARAQERCIYAMSDPTNDETVRYLCAHAPGDIQIEVLPGVTMADRGLCAALQERRDTQNARILSAAAMTQAQEFAPDPSAPLIITEIDDAMLAGEVKLLLMRLYEDEMPVWFVPATQEARGVAREIALHEMDRQGTYGTTCALFVPAAPMEERKKYVLADLLKIMQSLRAFDGCPWDRAQTHESLRPYLIEEASEACGAIDEGDAQMLCDELGDVLFQVVFHAQIAQEHAEFSMEDVVTAICEKMLERHPHVFAGKTYESKQAINAAWEAQKREKRGERTTSEAMRDVSRALPGLMRAQKIVKKAQAAGYTAAMTQSEGEEARMGALLMDIVKTAQEKGIDAEIALRSAVEHFVEEFAQWEQGPCAPKA